MINYLLQIHLLRRANENIQDAINESVNDVAKGKMYCAQDMLTAQIKTLMALDAKQTKDNETEKWHLGHNRRWNKRN